MPRPVLETANRLKINLQQEVSAPKVASSTDQVTTRVEDLGTVFRQKVALMREMLLEVVVHQPAPVQLKAV